jgi:HSP20 family molecular chaperone IbpA
VSESDLVILFWRAFKRENQMKRERKPSAKLVVLENDDLISSETEQLQKRVRGRAYELSQQRGHAGREVDDWLTAESEIISVPPAELIEKNGMFQVTFAILGINLQDVQVMASADQVLVRGDYRHHREAEDGIVHLCDFKSATLFRSVRFPEPIDVNSVDVQVEDGIVRITASKASATQTLPGAKRTTGRKAPARKRRAS